MVQDSECNMQIYCPSVNMSTWRHFVVCPIIEIWHFSLPSCCDCSSLFNFCCHFCFSSYVATPNECHYIKKRVTFPWLDLDLDLQLLHHSGHIYYVTFDCDDVLLPQIDQSAWIAVVGHTRMCPAHLQSSISTWCKIPVSHPWLRFAFTRCFSFHKCRLQLDSGIFVFIGLQYAVEQFAVSPA